MKAILNSAAIAVALVAGSSHAAIITFDGLPHTNGSAFTAPYSEAGYTVTTIAGEVFEGHLFGNPAPNLVVGTVFGRSNQGSIDVTRNGGGSFKLTSFDWTNFNGPGAYWVLGYSNGATVVNFASASDFQGFFQTVSGTNASVDRLVFNFTANGTSLNFDNLNLAAGVPEPASWAMMFAGFGLVGATLRRRANRVTYA